MILARLIRVCASALLCAGVSLFPGNASADGAGTVVDGRAILKMSKGSNLCALTFDDGPSSHTERLMEILRERGIHATFFVVGKQVKYHPELIVRLQQEGHEIGNHTYSHKSLRHLSVDAQRSEILSVQELLRKLGVHSRYIRPPYGNFDANTVAIAKAEGADIMLWSIDSMDWSKRASIENMKTLISGQKLRGVFLFHDTHEQTIEALPEILDRLIADGCQFVTVSEYLAALRQDALPEGVNVAAPAIQENPHQPVPPQGTQAEREAPQQLFQPGDVHEVRQPMAPRPKAAETPGAEQMAGHSTEYERCRTSGLADVDAVTPERAYKKGNRSSLFSYHALTVGSICRNISCTSCRCRRGKARYVRLWAFRGGTGPGRGHCRPRSTSGRLHGGRKRPHAGTGAYR